MPDCALIIMAKAPVPGYAKTRLIPALGPAGAARLAARLLSETLAQAIAARIGAVELCCAPDTAAFAAQWGLGPVVLSAQGDGDLGQRMGRAMERRLRQGSRVILIGTDVPGLDAAYLRAAHEALDQADAVFGPAADGGYTLIGLRAPAPRLFEGIPWSTDRVMAVTRERLAESGLRHLELPMLFDVDEPGDLIHVPAAWL